MPVEVNGNKCRNNALYCITIATIIHSKVTTRKATRPEECKDPKSDKPSFTSVEREIKLQQF